jgi:predicted RNA binding protein YcfA (HicA-like mRNA interferase family)
VKPERLLRRILGGEVANVAFADLVRLLGALGFRQIGGKGSHRIFARPGVTELVNLQEDASQAKPYQVRQVATLIRRYALGLEDDT